MNNKKKIYVTSDTHFGHGNIMKYCSRTEFMTREDKEKFLSIKDVQDPAYRNLKMSSESIKKMDDAILNNINEAVGPDDQLWILGDFAFSRKSHELYDYRERINCKDVRLVWGNHDDRYLLKQIYFLDQCQELFQGYYESGTFYETDEGLISEGEITEYYGHINPYKKKQRWYFNHYMNAVWNGSHKGVYHLYGHSHGEAEPWRERHVPNACAWDAGVDNNDYKPINLADQKKIFDKKIKQGKHVIDHH